jgi:hypothetical protein
VWMRAPKLTTTQWRTLGSIRRERFRNLISQKAMSEVFDGKFFERVQNQYNDLDKRLMALAAIQVPIFIVLAVSLIPINVEFSFFGISPHASKGWRELLLLARCCRSGTRNSLEIIMTPRPF